MKTKFLITLIFLVSFTNISLAQSVTSNFDWFITPYSSNSINNVLNSNKVITTSSNSNSSQVIIPATNNTSNTNTVVTANSTASYNVSNSNRVQIPQNVLLVIDFIKNKYSLNQPQIESLSQIARSYQYVLNNPPLNSADAYRLNILDVASTNCASTRLVGQVLDEATDQIEQASLDTQVKKNMYDKYTNFLDENSSNPQIIESCEDEFSQNTTNQNTSFQINLNGVILDQNITSKCLILTHFMEFGSRDSQVLSLQNFLMENGYLEMYPTGFFGRNTEFGVREWQKRHSIDIKGWAGPSTRGSIAGLTCKTQAAYDKAFKGETVKKYVAVKKVLARTPIDQPIKTKTIIIATTTTSAVDEFKTSTFTNPVSTNNLSSLGATFFTKRSPVNTLYFTYKANTALDDIYTCISKNGNNKCESSSNFTKVKQKYEPGNIDMINNTTKWIFNVYYNSDVWGTDGGNIYIRNGLGNISEVYSVKVTNSL